MTLLLFLAAFSMARRKIQKGKVQRICSLSLLLMLIKRLIRWRKQKINTNQNKSFVVVAGGAWESAKTGQCVCVWGWEFCRRGKLNTKQKIHETKNDIQMGPRWKSWKFTVLFTLTRLSTAERWDYFFLVFAYLHVYLCYILSHANREFSSKWWCFCFTSINWFNLQWETLFCLWLQKDVLVYYLHT